MKRLAALLALFILVSFAGPATAAPNIVVIMTDDLDTASLQHMPLTRALIRDAGMEFSQHIVSSPLCCPSRASFFRGQYAHNHRVWQNGAYHRLRLLEDDTLITSLVAAGYRTALIGKYANGYRKIDPLHIPAGWTTWAALISGRSYTHSVFNEDGVRVEHPGTYQTDLMRDKAVAFITSSPGPWLLYFAPSAPHLPATPAERHAGMFDAEPLPQPPSFNVVAETKPEWVRALPELTEDDIAGMQKTHRNRLRSLQAVDEAVEAIVTTLDVTGQLDNTYIFFTSDNGYHLGQHRLVGPPRLRTWKETPYDMDVRVPLLVRGPGVAPGSLTSKLSVNVDLAPTILKLAEVKSRAFMDGRDLVRTMFGGTGPGRTSALLELRPGPRTITVPPRYSGLRTGRYLYVEYVTGERELYDRLTDPDELNNLAATADACVLEALATRLALLRPCARAECRRLESEPLPVCAQ